MSYSAIFFNVASNSTDTLPDSFGYIGAAVAVVFFGSNYVPVKQYDTSDGMTFQFFLCLGIWLVGLAVYIWRNFPPFHPLVMLGGALWATGNVFVVPILQTIGLGLGILIWGTFNMLAGWASSRFGWFGIPAQVPSNTTLNYVGVTLCVLAASAYFFVKPEPANTIDIVVIDTDTQPSGDKLGRRRRSDQDGSISVYEDVVSPQVPNTSSLYPSVNDRYIRDEDRRPIVDEAGDSWQQNELFWMRMTPAKQRVFGIVLSILIGPMFGLSFAPTFFVQSHDDTASQNGLDYVYIHYTGIFIASNVYLLLYTAVKRNRPVVNPRILLPAVVSGIMWGIANAGLFVANQVLSESVAFPIVTTAPAAVAAIWSVCVFREIRGMKNLLILLVAFLITTAGSVLNGMSKS